LLGPSDQKGIGKVKKAEARMGPSNVAAHSMAKRVGLFKANKERNETEISGGGI
jgi:hypothetical protein